MKIRLFTEKDFPMIKSWWGMPELPIEVYPLESTYILEYENTPALIVAIYYTNCQLAAFMEGFCGNPEFKGEKRKEMGHHLLKHCMNEAKLRGYKRLIGQSSNAKLTQRWKDLGFQMLVENMSSLAKEI